MAIQLSRVVAAQSKGNDGSFSVRSIDLHELGVAASPVAVLDDFRVSGRPFGPHPHAGFSAVTYVFEDSVGDLRSRDSFGHDYVVGPGGIVWTLAGSGVLHEEVPADSSRELHGLQIFVNLSSRNKLTPPRVTRLTSSEVPEWRSDGGDRVRVVVGSYQGISSPLVPAEPFDILDVQLQHQISFDLRDAHNAIVYVLAGDIAVRPDFREQFVGAGKALALQGSAGGGLATFKASGPAHFLVLSGAEIREPVYSHGPFIMNDRSQVDAAFASYRAGAMGRLEPLTAR